MSYTMTTTDWNWIFGKMVAEKAEKADKAIRQDLSNVFGNYQRGVFFHWKEELSELEEKYGVVSRHKNRSR